MLCTDVAQRDDGVGDPANVVVLCVVDKVLDQVSGFDSEHAGGRGGSCVVHRIAVAGRQEQLGVPCDAEQVAVVVAA
eukprot:2071633-Rhodomonas_salina.1